MKELIGYLIDRTTGAGISGKAVAFKNLAGVSFASQASPYIGLDAVTDVDGRFRGRFEFSPGPVQVTVTVSGSEVKTRKWDEKAQVGYVWTSDIRNIARAIKDGVIENFLNELAVSIPSGHTIRIATGGAVFNGNVFSIENGNYDIAGTANTNPALNPRLDLITLRQYNESASGQDAGRQDVIVTLGTSQNVAPVTPTGSDFKDFPLAVVSTAYNATTKTITSDLRTFTGNATPEEPHFDIEIYRPIGTSFALSTSYATIMTPTVTGLDVRNTYDGEINVKGTITIRDAAQNTEYDIALKIDKPEMAGGAIIDHDLIQIFWDLLGNSDDYDLNIPFTFNWPIIGVAGSTSYSVPIQVKHASVAGSPSISVLNMYTNVILKKRV